MKLAQLHRAFWNKSVSSGIIKLHCQEIGVLGFFYSQSRPVEQLDFTNKDVIRYYQAKSRKAGYPLTAGFSIEHDVDFIPYQEIFESHSQAQILYSFPEINLEIENNQGDWAWRSLEGAYENFDNSIPRIEYKRCDSLICVN